MKDGESTYFFAVKKSLTKCVAKLHSKGPLLHHLMKKIHTTLRVIEEVFGHPVDVNLADEDEESTNLHGWRRRRDALEVFF
jgi:hypothetical protein